MIFFYIKILMRPYVRTVYLGLSFMIMFTSFNGLQNMLGQIYLQQGYKTLGSLSIFFIYALFSLSTLISPYFVNKVGYKYSFVLASLTYVAFSASGIYITTCNDHCNMPLLYFIVIFCSSLCGIGASVLWVAQGSYIGDLILWVW